MPGLSRRHCTVRRREGSVVVEDHSSFGTYLNDRRVEGRSAARIGDRIRLGSPGVELMFIAVRIGGGPCTGLAWRWGHGWPPCSLDLQPATDMPNLVRMSQFRGQTVFLSSSEWRSLASSPLTLSGEPSRKM